MKHAVLTLILVSALPACTWANTSSVDPPDRSSWQATRRLQEAALFASPFNQRPNASFSYNPTGFSGGHHIPLASVVVAKPHTSPNPNPARTLQVAASPSTLVTVPEPGTLGLLGTGLLGIAGLIRRKMKASPPNN